MIKRAQQLGKFIGLPRTNPAYTLTPVLIKDVEHDLVKGMYGCKEPKPGINRDLLPDELDMVIVPGVAFDSSGQRLGRGVGYYDRFLRQLPKDTPVVGLAFDFQLVDRLPVEEHDIPVSFVLSN
jgi:5-formyltetrahydrofolate cyclo-ligase